MNKVKQTRVLVLDDDKFMLEFVSHLLRELVSMKCWLRKMAKQAYLYCLRKSLRLIC